MNSILSNFISKHNVLIYIFFLFISLSNNTYAQNGNNKNQSNRNIETPTFAVPAKDPENKDNIYPDTIEGITWKINKEQWNENAVRRVIYTFAYGGSASDKQIKKWSEMEPDLAIKEILNFKAHNFKLSDLPRNDQGKRIINSYIKDRKNTSLRNLAKYFISGKAPVKVDPRDKGIDIWDLPAKAWLLSTMMRGLNPFKQKIGLFETNYHMAVNLNTEVSERMIYRYYDDIMNSHSNGKKYYDYVMWMASIAAAPAAQYRHRENIYKESQFMGNEDFGREFHQLYFKNLGQYAEDLEKYKPALPNLPLDHPSNNNYHEYTTIRNTARALSGLHIPAMLKWPWKKDEVDIPAYYDKFNGGWPEDEIEILGYKIKGKTAKEKLRRLTEVAIQFPESEHNLPVYVIRTLADDNLVEDGNESVEVKEKLKIIRALWKNFSKEKNYNLLVFLRMYAISKAFHNPTRYKYLTSIDRYVLIGKMSVINYDELKYYDYHYRLRREGVGVFRPAHDVFGGQTGIDASNTADVFRNAYNTSVREYWWAGKFIDGNWKNPKWIRDYSKIIPHSFKENGKRVWKVVDVAEWLWKRYIGTTKNFGFLERCQVYSFISSGKDFSLFVAGDSWRSPASEASLKRKYTEKDVMNNLDVRKKWEDLQKGLLFLDTVDKEKKRDIAKNIGSAINFIIATPYMFVQEGDDK